MNKDELLSLLDDEDVQRKIFSIAAGKVPDKFEPEKSAQDKIAQLESELQKARAEIFQLNQRICQREKDFQSKLSAAENSEREQKRRADQLQQTFQEESQRLKDDKDRAERKMSQLQSSIKQLQEQLNERFGRGWELFQKYHYLGDHSRQILGTAVFQREDDFTSFICSAAQPNSLEIIWDTARDATFNDQSRDAETLWQIFLYALELVNSSRAQASYSVLPVSLGDKFDTDFHAEGPNSRAQGIVSQIFIAGFKNNYSGKIHRKSIVQVS